MAEQTRHPGLILGVARFYHDPRGSARGMINSDPGEARLLAYAMIAVALLLTGRLITVMANAGPDDDVPGLLTGQVVSMLFFVPLAYYGLAAIGTSLARLCGGQGGWRDGRAAFFWAALVSAPVILLTVLGNLIATGLPDIVGTVIRQFGAIFFAWAVARCFAEIFGFTRPWLVFIVVCSPAFLLVLAAWVTRL